MLKGLYRFGMLAIFLGGGLILYQYVQWDSAGVGYSLCFYHLGYAEAMLLLIGIVSVITGFVLSKSRKPS